MVLAGTGTHPAGADLPTVSAVAATVADLADAFTQQCEVAPENLAVVVDPASPLDLGQALTRAAVAATDVLVFYYVGHGLVGENGGELHLATSATDDRSVGLAYKALPYSAVRDALIGCRAPLLVVVLDCCFSGRAGNSFALGTLRAAELTGVHGSYLLTSAARDELALAPVGARHTAFSGALIELLTTGDPTGPAELTLDHAYRHLTRVLAERNAPRPHRQAGDRGGELVLAANPGAAETPAGAAGLPAPSGESICPYRGMRRYDREDARWFFGREAMTTELVRRVTATLAEPGMVVVIGPSGSGKSSLLRAGLLPALAEDDTVGARYWPQLVFTPGEHPMSAVAAKLEGRPATAETIGASLRAAYPDAERVVLVVDQFEELFTAGQDEDERRAFLRALVAAAGAGPDGAEPAAVVVLGVRADFYQHCLRHPELARALSDGQVPVIPMTEAELREVIRRPAESAGLTVEPALVDLLLTDMNTGADTASALPLLSYALVETWHKRAGATLTVAGYQATTGVWQAVRRRADEAYQSLDAQARQAARRLLLSMIRLGEDTADTRHPLDIATLAVRPDDPTDRALRALAEANLVTVDATTVSITHEALVRAWPLLRGWLTDNRQELLARQQLRDAASSWQRDGRDPAGLYQGGRLEAVRGWRDRSELTEVEREFLAASTAGHRRRLRRRRSVIGALAALTVLALIATGVAVTKANNAFQQQQTSLSEALSFESANVTATNIRKADMLAMAAWQTAHNAASLGSLLSSESTGYLGAFTGHADYIEALAINPAGTLLASGDKSGAVIVWNLKTRRLLRKFTVGGNVSALAFSPDGATLTAGVVATQGVHQWDTTTFQPLPNDYPTVFGVSALAYSPDGRTLAVAAIEGDHQTTHVGDVRLWDTATHHSSGLIAASTTYVQTVVYSPDGRLMGTAGYDNTARLWDATTHALTTTFAGHTAPVWSLAFSRDGGTVATGGADGTVRVWNVASGASKKVESTGAGTIPAVQFAPGNDWLLMTDTQGDISFYDLSTGTLNRFPLSVQAPLDRLVFSPDGHTLVAGGISGNLLAVGWSRTGVRASASVTGVAVSPDGRQVATGAADGSVVLWPVDNPADQRRLDGQQGEVSQVAFNRDGTRLAVAGVDGIAVWAVTTGRQIATLKPPDSALVDDVAFAPDGHTLVTSSLTAASDGEVDFWDADAFRLLGSLPKHDNGSGRVSFSPDGRLLATTGTGKVQLWDARTRRLVDTLDTGSAYPHVGDVAFSPNGSLLATSVDNPANDTQNVQFWDVVSRKSVGTLTDLASTVTYIAFSPDSATLATIAQENVVRLWNVADPTPLATIDAASPGSPVNVVAFSPVGRALVSGGSDFNATYWTLDPDAQFAHLCQVLGAPTFDVEWRALDPNIGPPPSCVGSSPS